MQVIFRGAYWLRFWAQLQRDEQAKDTLVEMSKKLEMIALEITNRGWKHFFTFALDPLSMLKTIGLVFIFSNSVLIGCVHPRM